MAEAIFLPTLPHWTFGNHWSGSRAGTRFYVAPSGEEMTAQVWDEDVCRALATIRAEAVFPVTQEGLDTMGRWLEEQTAPRSERGG